MNFIKYNWRDIVILFIFIFGMGMNIYDWHSYPISVNLLLCGLYCWFLPTQIHKLYKAFKNNKQ